MVVIMSKSDAEVAKKLLETAGETVYEIGTIRTQNNGEAATVVI